ncbi:MAG: helix-turn-helix domain-containing protein [Kiritimatiellia bacterium]
MAREAGMSARQFNRAFRDATGSPPVAYVLRLRVNHAAGLLRHEAGLNVTEAAFRSGFSDSNYFSRQFHRAFGLSPRAYRRLHAVE